MIRGKQSKKRREKKRYFGDGEGGGIRRRRQSGLSRHESAAHEGCCASIEFAASVHFCFSLLSLPLPLPRPLLCVSCVFCVNSVSSKALVCFLTRVYFPSFPPIFLFFSSSFFSLHFSRGCYAVDFLDKNNNVVFILTIKYLRFG